jgi:hypothetical protein
VSDHYLTLGVESYNTTNLRNGVEEDMTGGPRWRHSSFTQRHG